MNTKGAGRYLAKTDAGFARFDAKLEQRVAELRAEMHAGFAALDIRMAAFESRIIRWMFVFWVGTLCTVVAPLKL